LNVNGTSFAVFFHQPGMSPRRIETSSGPVSPNLTTSARLRTLRAKRSITGSDAPLISD
jgi:hypothetical protein